jgi:hypothetical protein
MELQSNANLRPHNAFLPVTSVFQLLFPIYNSVFVTICLHTVPPSAFCSSPQSISLRTTFKYLTCSSFTSRSVNMANPIRLTVTSQSTSKSQKHLHKLFIIPLSPVSICSNSPKHACPNYASINQGSEFTGTGTVSP